MKAVVSVGTSDTARVSRPDLAGQHHPHGGPCLGAQTAPFQGSTLATPGLSSWSSSCPWSPTCSATRPRGWSATSRANRSTVLGVEGSGRTKGRFEMRRNAIWLVTVALVVGGATTAVATSGNFRTHLSGDEEFPEAVVTGAQG